MKLVSVIIVNWNGIRFLKDCLSSIYKQKYKKIEVIVVDNASIDDSVKFIKKNFPKVKIIRNKKNLGFAEANNIGYFQSKGELILFLNNDTKVTNNFLMALVKAIEKNPKAGGVQSKIFLMNENKTLDSVGAFLTNTGFLYHYGVAKKDSTLYDRSIPIFSAKGACMLFKKEVLEAIRVKGEIFDSRYFAYFEETDMCHRVWLAGFEIFFIPSSVIFHVMGGTSKKLASAFVQGHSFKNRINSYLKNLETLSLFKLLPIHLVMCEIVSFVYLFKKRPDLFYAINWAIWWNIVNLPQTLSKRTIIQEKIRQVSDFQLLSIIQKKVGIGYYFQLFFGLRSFKDIQL